MVGLHNGKPIFWVSKSHERVARMNWETGKPEKTEQWIIRLDATGLDMMEVLAGPVERIALPAPEIAVVEIPVHADAVAKQGESIVRAKHEINTAVTELRAQLGALRDTLGWTNEELLEWIDGQGYTAAQPAHDLECLRNMTMKLNASAEAKARREEGDGQALEGEVMPVGDDDSGEPF